MAEERESTVNPGEGRGKALEHSCPGHVGGRAGWQVRPQHSGREESSREGNREKPEAGSLKTL